MLIRRAKVFNTYLRNFAETSVLVRGGIFAALGEAAEEIHRTAQGEEDREVLDAEGTWLVPGLVDIHMHIESSMTVPSEFSRAVLPHGTTTVVADPHEIANVFGEEGVRAFMDVRTDLDIFWGLPSSVPSTNSALETSGGSIGPEEIASLAADPRVVCLGEVMNAADLSSSGDTPTKRLVAAFKGVRPYAPVEGHCPRITGARLAAFIASGVWADHTQQTPESILEKASNGMFIQLQRKSLTAENVRTVVERRLFEHVCLVTDDVMPDHLEEGHLNLLVTRAMELGMRVEEAVYCATYVPSRHMGLRDRGAIAPGRVADFILLDDPETFKIRSVFKRGTSVGDGKRSAQSPKPRGKSGQTFPPHFYASIRRKPLTAEDFLARPPDSALRRTTGSPGSDGETVCVAIGIEPNSTFTDYVKIPCAVRNGVARWQDAGLALIASIERYGKQAPVRLGFVSGAFRAKGAENAPGSTGAVATTWAHDSHNILVMGTGVSDMVLAANALIEGQGGYVVFADGEEKARASLPVGGIVSDGPIEKLARDIRTVRAAMRSLGYAHSNEIMSFSTLPLLVSPRLKISDKGLVDVPSQRILESYELPHP